MSAQVSHIFQLNTGVNLSYVQSKDTNTINNESFSDFSADFKYLFKIRDHWAISLGVGFDRKAYRDYLEPFGQRSTFRLNYTSQQIGFYYFSTDNKFYLGLAGKYASLDRVLVQLPNNSSRDGLTDMNFENQFVENDFILQPGIGIALPLNKEETLSWGIAASYDISLNRYNRLRSERFANLRIGLNLQFLIKPKKKKTTPTAKP